MGMHYKVDVTKNKLGSGIKITYSSIVNTIGGAYQVSGEILRIIGQAPSVSKSNSLHVVIFRISLLI